MVAVISTPSSRRPGCADAAGTTRPDLRPDLRLVPRPTPRRPAASTYRRRRLLATGVAAAALVAGWFALQAIAGGAGDGPLTVTGATGVTGAVPAAARTYVVEPGDTLWGIALASGARGDIRPYVDQLSAETHDQPLVPGERIALPAAG